MLTIDQLETRKLIDTIQNRLTISNIQEGNILWFFNIDNPYRSKTFRDDRKNLWKIYDRPILVSIEAGINPAGVGDGKLPTHAMTYSINYSIHGQSRSYRCKRFYESEYRHRYQYSRDIETVVEKFIQSLKENNIL